MLDCTKRALAALATGLALAIATSTAGAAPVVVEPTRVRAVWSTMSFANSASTIRCPVTLEGSIHSSTFNPAEGLQVGYVTRASAAEGSCTGGRVRLLAETLPWRIRYESAVGTLPEISGIRLRVVGVAARGEASGATCLYQSSEARPLRATLEVTPQTIATTGLRLDESASLPLVTGGFPCELGGEARASGTATVKESGTTNEVDLVSLDEAPLLVRPSERVTLNERVIRSDVRLEATRNRRTGFLSVRGDYRADYSVSRGCDDVLIGPTATPSTFCTVTVSFTGSRARFAFVEVPIEGLNRYIYLRAD